MSYFKHLVEDNFVVEARSLMISREPVSLKQVLKNDDQFLLVSMSVKLNAANKKQFPGKKVTLKLKYAPDLQWYQMEINKLNVNDITYEL